MFFKIGVRKYRKYPTLSNDVVIILQSDIEISKECYCLKLLLPLSRVHTTQTYCIRTRCNYNF